DSFLASTGIRRQPSSAAALFHAGQAWSTYGRRRPSTLECPQCGSQQNVQCGACGARVQARQNVVADFVIGAHALAHADRLLTRDRRYYATYFPTLQLE